MPAVGDHGELVTCDSPLRGLAELRVFEDGVAQRRAGRVAVGGFSLAGRTGHFTWLCQAVTVALCAVCEAIRWGHAPRARTSQRAQRAPHVAALPDQPAGHDRPLDHRGLRGDRPSRAVPGRPRPAGARCPGRPGVPAPDHELLPSHGHRRAGALDPCGVHLERPHLAGRRAHGDRHLHGPGRRHRYRRGLLRGLGRRGLDAHHRRLPGHPLAAPGDGPGGRLGPPTT